MTEYEIPNPYVLAGMAGCASPDTEDSAGALFLTLVADSVRDLVAEDEDRDEIPFQAADECVPIYTHKVWRTFVDLAAWQEDPTDLSADASDMEQCAKVCLLMIGERLAWAILEDMGTEDEDE